MISKTALLALDFFDFFHKKKIKKFFTQNYKRDFNLIFDIGAHKGETILFFLKNFRVNEIISFEPSFLNFQTLKKNSIELKRKFNNSKITLENFGIGEKREKLPLKQHSESSSSTINEFNEDSNYFKKKNKILNLKNDIYNIVDINVIPLYEYIEEKKIEKIDLLKIDTEGYEFQALLSLREKMKIVKYIMFEHHFDDMIKKKYTFGDINKLLAKNNFKKVFKLRMPFRKSFEYIYINVNN